MVSCSLARHGVRPATGGEVGGLKMTARSRSGHLAHSGREAHHRKNDGANEAQDHDLEMRGAAGAVRGGAHRTLLSRRSTPPEAPDALTLRVRECGGIFVA